jgi:8-oxo-dGTP pyrophosphatase MutT (NUDIX family)
MSATVAHRLLNLVPDLVRRKAVWWTVWLTQPKFLVSVCALLRTPDDRYLVFEHRFWEGGRWGVPSGHMESFETPEQTATRELREESGLEARDMRVVGVERSTKNRVEIWCTGTVDVAEAPDLGSLERREITDVDLLPADELLERLRPEQAHVVRQILGD